MGVQPAHQHTIMTGTSVSAEYSASNGGEGPVLQGPCSRTGAPRGWGSHPVRPLAPVPVQSRSTNPKADVAGEEPTRPRHPITTTATTTTTQATDPCAMCNGARLDCTLRPPLHSPRQGPIGLPRLHLCIVWQHRDVLSHARRATHMHTQHHTVHVQPCENTPQGPPLHTTRVTVRHLNASCTHREQRLVAGHKVWVLKVHVRAHGVQSPQVGDNGGFVSHR